MNHILRKQKVLNVCDCGAKAICIRTTAISDTYGCNTLYTYECGTNKHECQLAKGGARVDVKRGDNCAHGK